MKKPISKPTLHKIWAWISLELNFIILLIIYVADSGELYMVFRGMIVAIGLLIVGLLKIYHDVSIVKDDSNASVWITYIGTFGLSCGILFFDEVPSLATWVMIPLLLIEALIAILIARKRRE